MGMQFLTAWILKTPANGFPGRLKCSLREQSQGALRNHLVISKWCSKDLNLRYFYNFDKTVWKFQCGGRRVKAKHVLIPLDIVK